MRNEVAINNITFIQKGSHIEGDIDSTGKVHISGSLTGYLSSKEHTVINLGGIVRGSVTTNRAEISGELHGDIRVNDLLTLKSSARIFGNIYAKFLLTEEGSQINGFVHSGKDVDVSQKHNSKEEINLIPKKKAG